MKKYVLEVLRLWKRDGAQEAGLGDVYIII